MIRVLIAEDSASSRAYLKFIVDSADDMEVVAVAENGEQAAELTRRMHPDVVAMDIHMPVLDGCSATRQIMASCPTPVVIVSSLVNGSASQETFRILEAGAVAAVPKPSGPKSKAAVEDRHKLLCALRQVAGLQVTAPAESSATTAVDSSEKKPPVVINWLWLVPPRAVRWLCKICCASCQPVFLCRSWSSSIFLPVLFRGWYSGCKMTALYRCAWLKTVRVSNRVWFILLRTICIWA